MQHYNTKLKQLRDEKGLSLKEASKAIGIFYFQLYLYENGYFHPSKRALKKIEKFYGTKISLEGESSYPAPTRGIQKENKRLTKNKRIAYATMVGISLIAVLFGSLMFSSSVNNVNSFYGPTYNEMREKVKQDGETGHDLVTNLPYHYVNDLIGGENASIVFYDTDNILFINECTYTTNAAPADMKIGRVYYNFGSNLGVSSYLCKYTYASSAYGLYFSCNFIYEGKEITEVQDLSLLTPAETELTNDLLLTLINFRLSDAVDKFSALLTKELGREVDFYTEFLADREKGRVINYDLQIAGLISLILGILSFFLFLEFLVRDFAIHFKPRLVSADFDNSKGEEHEPLPNDISLRVGIPDISLIIGAKVVQFTALLLLFLSLLGVVGLPLPSIFSNADFLNILRIVWLGAIILVHFVMIGRIKKASTLFRAIAYNLFLFLFIATIETVLIAVTNAWGYDLASLIYSYVPSNVFQVVAVHYLIFLFLFFQPPFLLKGGKKARIIWHSLSIIPLGYLVTSYFISNSYNLIYGVKENIFVNFWFPNGFIALSIIAVLFMYATFFVRLFFEKKYGKIKSQLYFFGDRYLLIENSICVLIIIAVALIDLAFVGNQYAYYCGLGTNLWILALIPFAFLTKFSPNNQEIISFAYEGRGRGRNRK